MCGVEGVHQNRVVVKCSKSMHWQVNDTRGGTLVVYMESVAPDKCAMFEPWGHRAAYNNDQVSDRVQ